jgi:acetyl-CoA acyltransferase
VLDLAQSKGNAPVRERVLIAGVGMTRFNRSPGRGLRDMSLVASREALVDAGHRTQRYATDLLRQCRRRRGNRAGDDSRGGGAARQRARRPPVFNIENACASGSSALSLAAEAIGAGSCDVVLVVGVEQLNHVERYRTFSALRGSTDIEEIGESVPGMDTSHSVLMDFYAEEAARYLEESGALVSDLAAVAFKNRLNAAHNPLAQYRTALTVEEVLGARKIAEPLTLPMCAPTTDGAAAIVLCSADYAGQLNGRVVELLTSELRSGTGAGSHPVADAATAAYMSASLGPDDLDLVEYTTRRPPPS